MSAAASWLPTVFLAACVSSASIGVYDVTVRQPRTPRLALIDIARLYAAADQGLKSRALEGGATAAAGVAATAGTQGLRNAGDFGPMLEAALQGLAVECRCAIVAMATVIGADSTVPDFTEETARRMGLVLREGSRR